MANPVDLIKLIQFNKKKVDWVGQAGCYGFQK
jgi:hypothetical protein